MNDIVGSVMAGCASTLVGHPLDTIKVHQQTQPHLFKESSIRVAKSLAREDTFGLFRGIGPPMMNQIIMNTVMFSVFHKVKACANNSSILDENVAAMCAGLVSGFATACISTPTDWIKIQAQLNQGGKSSAVASSSSIDILRQLMHDQRYRSTSIARILYRGHVANLAREGVFTMVYLGLYDRICSIIVQGGGDSHMNMGTVVMVSSFTGACAWICNYPFDTIKTVMQGEKAGQITSSTTTSSSGTISMGSAIRSIWASGGVRAFYRGIGTSTFRAMLVTSIRMLAYEKTKQLLAT